MALGQNIKKYRKEKKMTQKELATLVGVNEVTIRSYEAEKYRPKIGTLQKIAEALDVSLVALDPVLYENTFDKRVGENIAAVRTRINMSQDDLGKLLNISPHDIERLESGTTAIRTKDIENIAEKLKVPVEALIFGADVDHKDVLKDDKTPFGRKLSKQLAVIKFLDALYYRADITKVKIYSKDTKEEKHNDQYVSFSYDKHEELCFDYGFLEKLISAFENICKNFLPLVSQKEEVFLSDQYFSSDTVFYHLFRETISFQTTTKIKYEPLSDKEIENIRKEIEENANKEEFVIEEPSNSEKDNKLPNS